MTESLFSNTVPPHSPFCGGCEEELNLYLDGELPFADQPRLFSRLASCLVCREQFNATMRFRQLAREERIELPPAVDDAFFRKLAERQKSPLRVNRYADRRPLWEVRRQISLRSIAFGIILAFVSGIQFGDGAFDRFFDQTRIRQQVEYVSLEEAAAPVPHYLIFPGLMVEEDSHFQEQEEASVKPEGRPRTDAQERTYMVP